MSSWSVTFGSVTGRTRARPARRTPVGTTSCTQRSTPALPSGNRCFAALACTDGADGPLWTTGGTSSVTVSGTAAMPRLDGPGTTSDGSGFPPAERSARTLLMAGRSTSAGSAVGRYRGCGDGERWRPAAAVRRGLRLLPRQPDRHLPAGPQPRRAAPVDGP